LTLTALFEAGNPDSTTITYAVNDATMGTTTPAPGTYTIYVGNSISATATPNSGYQLSAWMIGFYSNAGALLQEDTILADDPDFANPMNFGALPQSFADYGYTITITAVFEAGAVEPCAVPTGLTVASVENHTVTVTWDANANVNSWNIRYRKANESNWNSATANTNSYTISDLDGNTDYEIQVQADCGDGNQSDWTASATAHTTNVGISSWMENSVKVFPNPANDVVNVQCTMYNVQLGADLHVFDVYGKLVQTVPMTGETTSVNVSNLADGMYFVRVTTEEGAVTKPFVVKR
jgi:hypothetical protein